MRTSYQTIRWSQEHNFTEDEYQRDIVRNALAEFGHNMFSQPAACAFKCQHLLYSHVTIPPETQTKFFMTVTSVVNKHLEIPYKSDLLKQLDVTHAVSCIPVNFRTFPKKIRQRTNILIV